MTSSFAVPREFATDRLRLRKPSPDDAQALFEAYTQDEDVVRFLTWKPHASIDDTRAFLQWCDARWAQGEVFPYVIELRDGTAGPVGMIDLRRAQHTADFGYVLARPFWGKGIVAEALKALVDWSLAQPDIWRATAFCDAENPASARVMEKAGMRYEGLLRRYFVHPNVSAAPRDCTLYAKVKEDV